MTELLTAEEVVKAAEWLKKGEIVAFPTETVYGLGAPIFNPGAVQKIYLAKGRPSDNPLIAHFSTLEQLKRIAIDIPEDFYRLAQFFMPGPLTVILRRHPQVPSLVSAGLGTIAVRMPSHPLARQLIDLVGEPLVAPSANLSGRPSATQAKHALKDLEGKIAAIIDGGPSQLGLESTVIDLCSEMGPILLRPGQITKRQLEQVLGKEIVDGTLKINDDEPVPSPGMKYRHYAPEAPIKLFDSWATLMTFMKAQPPLQRMLLAASSPPAPLKGCDYFLLSSQELYTHLRIADEKGYQEILVLCDEEVLSEHALMNRLTRAASG